MDNFDEQIKNLEIREKRIRNRTIWITILVPVLTVVFSYFTTITTIESEIKLDKMNYTQENISSILKDDNIINARKKLKFLLDAGLIGGDEISSDSILNSLERNLINKNESIYHFALGVASLDNAIEFYYNNPSAKLDTIIKLYTEANNEFLIALELDPSNWEAMAYIGIAYLNMGEDISANTFIEKALTEYDKAIKINPGVGWIHADMAHAYYLLGIEQSMCFEAKLADSLGGLGYERLEKVSYYLETFCGHSY